MGSPWAESTAYCPGDAGAAISSVHSPGGVWELEEPSSAEQVAAPVLLPTTLTTAKYGPCSSLTIE
jgi:hypothetical protein